MSYTALTLKHRWPICWPWPIDGLRYNGYGLMRVTKDRVSAVDWASWAQWAQSTQCACCTTYATGTYAPYKFCRTFGARYNLLRATVESGGSRPRLYSRGPSARCLTGNRLRKNAKTVKLYTNAITKTKTIPSCPFFYRTRKTRMGRNLIITQKLYYLNRLAMKAKF